VLLSAAVLKPQSLCSSGEKRLDDEATYNYFEITSRMNIKEKG